MFPDLRKGIAKAEEKKTEAEMERKKSEAKIKESEDRMKKREEKKKAKADKKSSSSGKKKKDDDHETGVAKPQDHVCRGKIFQYGKVSLFPTGKGLLPPLLICLTLTSLKMMISLWNGMNGPRSKEDEVRRPHGTMIMCMTSTRERWSQPQLCTTPDLLFMNHATRSGMFIHFLVCHASINVIIIEKRIMLMMMVLTSIRCSTQQ